MVGSRLAQLNSSMFPNYQISISYKLYPKFPSLFVARYCITISKLLVGVERKRMKSQTVYDYQEPTLKAHNRCNN